MQEPSTDILFTFDFNYNDNYFIIFFRLSLLFSMELMATVNLMRESPHRPRLQGKFYTHNNVHTVTTRQRVGVKSLKGLGSKRSTVWGQSVQRFGVKAFKGLGSLRNFLVFER